MTIGAYGFDIGTMMYAMALTIVGYQAVLFAVLSKVYALHEGFLPASDRFDVFQRRLNLENLIGLGAVIVLAGVLWMVVSLLWWQDAGFGELPPEDSARAVAPAVLGLVLGVQTVMAGLFLSLLRIRVLHPGAGRGGGRARSSRALSRAGAHRRAATSRTARTTRCPRTVIRRRATVAETGQPGIAAGSLGPLEERQLLGEPGRVGGELRRLRRRVPAVLQQGLGDREQGLPPDQHAGGEAPSPGTKIRDGSKGWSPTAERRRHSVGQMM